MGESGLTVLGPSDVLPNFRVHVGNAHGAKNMSFKMWNMSTKATEYITAHSEHYASH